MSRVFFTGNSHFGHDNLTNYIFGLYIDTVPISFNLYDTNNVMEKYEENRNR